MSVWFQFGDTAFSVSGDGEWFLWTALIGVLWVGFRATRDK